MFEFHKMHGLGNHFIFFDEMKGDFSKLKHPGIIQTLCNGSRGIGGDGVIFIMNPANSKHQCRMQMFNVDGSEAEMCGNAIRCVAHHYRKHHHCLPGILIETKGGLREVYPADQKKGVSFYKVDMGRPEFELVSTGELAPLSHRKKVVWHDEELSPVLVNVGNPHAVIFLEAPLAEDEMVSLGPWMETHPNYPKRINVEFVEIISETEIKVSVWERGCGMTSACGTGATASAAAGMKIGKLASPVTVHMPGGDLIVSRGDRETLFMTGPVQEVAYGKLSRTFVNYLLSRV